MIASGVFAGVFDLEYGHSRKDADGRSIGEELQRIGYLGEETPGDHPIRAFFEAHIEQGPILEAEKTTIGVVTGAQGQRWLAVTLDRMSTRLNSSHKCASRMPSSAGHKKSTAEYTYEPR